MAIPISVDVHVIPGVLSASGDAVDLNGLIITTSTYMPASTALKFTSAADVATYFGSSSTEYSMATIYFKGYDNTLSLPGALYFYRYDEEATGSIVRSGALSNSDLSAIKLLSGTMKFSINNTEYSADVDFSSITSMYDVADIIGQAFESEMSVEYAEDVKSLFLTSTATGGSVYIIPYNSDMSIALKLQLNVGATYSYGSDYQTPYAAMGSITESLQDFATFCTTYPVDSASALSFSQFASNSSYRYSFVMFDSSPSATTASSTDCLAYVVAETYDYSNVIPVYGDQTHASSVMGYGASLNFDVNNGRRSLKYRALSGLLTQADTTWERTNLLANGYNFYGSYAQNNISENYWSAGTITGAYKWIDAYLGQIWLNANLQSAILSLFMSEIYLPYGTAGRVAIEAACTDVISQFKAWGGITTNTTLTSTQKQSIYNTVGTDVSATLANQGYYLYIGPFTAAMRAARTSPVCILWYTDGGVIQSLTIDSIEVQ